MSASKQLLRKKYVDCTLQVVHNLHLMLAEARDTSQQRRSIYVASERMARRGESNRRAHLRQSKPKYRAGWRCPQTFRRRSQAAQQLLEVMQASSLQMWMLVCARWWSLWFNFLSFRLFTLCVAFLASPFLNSRAVLICCSSGKWTMSYSSTVAVRIY